MFDARAHISALDTLDQGGGHLSRQIGILGEVFEITAAQRAALNIHRRSQQDAQAFTLAGVAQGFAHLFDHVRIKGSCRRAGCGKADCLDAVVDTEMITLQILLAQAVGTVADHRSRDSEAFHSLRMPEIPAGTKSGLFFQRHLGDQLTNVLYFHTSPQSDWFEIMPSAADQRYSDPRVHGSSVRQRSAALCRVPPVPA